ncbi:Ig-like domain-containing protein [Escherichia coli]
MAGKAHGNGDRRGDNTICGLGDRLRRLTAGICLITQTIFPVMAAAPTHINPAHSDTAASLILPNVKTIPYTLGALESPPTVAARFGITVDELRRLNQFRTFARGFDNVRQGDEMDVPLINSNSPEARNLKAMQMERDGKDPQMQVAEVAQQSGTLLARDMDSEQAASMARGWVASSASAQATDWLSRWGTARVSLGVDEDFSLKSSSFEFLHPWYETPDNLVFSQHTLHRTDDRTQTNHGIGWRYFTPSWMSGVNMFIDHDLTRYHTRTGMGVEYWRNYLKLSGNGYLRLSNWRSAPELDNDYEARPANGWDLRAEGWLPAWPQLGGKLVYEQYYGDEVALFGKDERQNDPHAITAGLSYTPVPLISFSAEQRQGKQGENDTRIGMELTLQPGHSLQKQLDPAEVAARRSLVGSRYDLVDRNNNIVLEYRKKELVRLTLTDPLKGKPGEVKSLVSSLQTKYALKGYDIEAASLQSAGGKVAVSGKDIQVTIPPYRFTAMPETDNTYPIAVTAEDSKGNFSRREESMVVVEKPTLSLADSTLSVDLQILLADGKSTSTLTYTARDSSGKPIPGMTLKTQVKGLQDFALSEWKDNGNGTYTQIVTAGKTSGALSLMPQFNGDDIAKTPALIAIVANTASRADSTIETDQDNYVAGKPIVVKVTLKDDNGNGVTGRKELLKQTVKVDNTKADAVSAWTEESEGIYKASYTAHLIGDKLTAQLTMPGWQTKHSDAFSIAGDKDTAKIAAMQITANNAVARRDHNTVAVTVRDVHQNLLQGQNVTFTVVNGAAVFADPNGGIVTTDKDGIASVNLASDQAVNSLIKAETNGSSQSVEVSFITGDISQLTSTIKTDDVSYTAGGKIKVSVTLMDEQKNLVKGMASLLAGSGVVEVSGTDKNETGNWSEESDGVYTTTRTAKIAGDRHYATLKLSTWSSAQQSDAYAIRESGAVLAYSSIVTDKTTYTAGGAIKVTVTLKDSFENLVGGQRDAVNQAIQLPNTKAESIAWNEDQKGIYTATYTALLPGTGLKAQLQMSGWANALTSNDYSISGDAASAQIVAMQVTTGNPDVLPEQTVTFTVTKGAAVFANAGQSADIRTDAHGMAEVDLSSAVADASTVEAKVNQSSDSKTVNFVADVSTAQVAELVVIKDGSEADGSTANTLRVKVTDAFGNTLAGQTVSVLADNGATVAPTVITEPDGTVEISVTSQTAGTSVVTASVNNSSQSRNVTFVADVRTAKIADLVVTRDNSVADGAMANTLRVRVTDAFGNTLAGQTVSVMADNSATVSPTVTTEPDGTVEISITSQTAGTSTGTASINNSSLSRNVTFIADVRTAKIADLVVIKDDSVADGVMANMLRARVTDAFGNVLAGQTVSVTADNGATVAPVVITGPDGTVEISVTSQTAGTSAITASINNSSLSRNVTFVADVRTAKIADLVVTRDNSVADGAMANTLQVKVTDANGNTLAGQTVSVLADNSATTAPTVITEPDGTVEISVTSQTAGTSTVTATINSSSQSQNVTFIADIRTAQIADLVVIKDGSVADGSTANMLRVRVTDAFGNALGGQTVSVLADNGVTTAPTVITEPDGTVEISVTSQTAGVSAVTATINSSSQSQNVTFIADVSTAKIADLVVIKDGSEADGSTANTLRARVTDAFGNTLGGQTVSVLADNGATVAPTVTTQPDGTVEISVTSQTAGTSTVTASINSSSQSRDVTFIADVRTAKIAELEVIRDNAVADGSTANTLQVKVTDANGNALAGQMVSVLADNSATTAPTVITGQDGTVEISVTSQTAGISAVTASINNSTLSRDVKFIADVSTAQIADLVVIKDGSVADGSTANTLQVKVTDAFGNALNGQTVSVLADNGATVAPTMTTKPDGTVEISVTSQTAGISAVTATINNSTASQNVMFIADVRTAQIADLVVIKDDSVADGAMANMLRARVTDAFGNALAGQTVSVLAGNGATTAPTVTTQPDGTVEIIVTSQTAGTSTVTASINNSSQSQNVTFVPGDASQLTSTVETNKSNYTVGETITITVTLRDAFDNLVTGAASQLAADGVLTVAGTDPSETGSWVESGGVYTTTRMATIASTNQHANLQLQTWSDGVTSDRYDIQSGSPAQATSTIATDKNAYTAGDTITVAVTLKDAHGNLVEGGESLLSGDNVTVEGAVRSGGWSETAGVYTATWSAQMAGDSHHATLKLSEWGSSKQSESYSIHSGAPVQANSAIRTDKSAYIAGEPLTVTITLRDEFGNPALGLTSEVIESYIDSFAVGGATHDAMRWVEQNNGEYTIVWTAWVAEENLVASLKLKTWATEIKSSLYGIQPGAAAKTQSTIVADKTIYIAGDSITVTVVLKDAQGNFITDGVVQLNEENVQVRNADPIQGNNWVYNGNGQYQRQYMAHFAEANLNAQLKMAGWSDANYSNNYTIKPGEVSPLGSQLRIREVLVVEGADLPVSALLVDDFGNPVDNGLDLLDDAVYLQNVEKKEGEKWRYVGDGIYERTYMAYQEGENLTSFMEIKGWRIYGQPSYTILPFVEVESLSVNGAKFRAADGFPETGFDGAKFTLLLTHNMKNTDYNWTAGIYGINVDSNGEVTLSVLIRSEVTITGKPKNGKGNDVVFKFKIKKWFTSLGATSSNTWDIINTSCSYGQMPSSLELAQRPSGGVVPRKVGTLWGEYGNLKTYGNAFSGTDYWTSTQLMGVHEKFNPETGISELGTGKSSGLCVEYY